MTRLISVWFIVLSCAFAWPTASQTAEPPVPIVKAPYHRPVFTNQYVTLLDRNSGYHTHSQDSVSVNIIVGQQTNQNFGSDTITPPAGGGERGRATFFPYVKDGPRTHKTTNIGKTPFHNVSFLLTSPTPYKTTPSTRAVHGFTQVMDNERVRGWRVQLAPGQSTGQMTQSAPGLRIVVAGGEIAELVPGVADRAWWLGQGQYFWQELGTTRSIKNVGTTPVDFVEFELK